MSKEFDKPVPDDYRGVPFDGDVLDGTLAAALDQLPVPAQNTLGQFFDRLDKLTEFDGSEGVLRVVSDFMSALEGGNIMEQEQSGWFIRVDSSFCTYLDGSDHKPELYLITSFEADPGIASQENPKLRTHAFNQECWFDGIPSFREFCAGIEAQVFTLFDHVTTLDFDEPGPNSETPVHVSFVFNGDFAENFKKMVEGVPDDGLKPWMISLRDSNVESDVESGDILFEIFSLEDIIGDRVKASILATDSDSPASPEDQGVL